MVENWDFLDVSVRDAARDVDNRILSFEEAAKQYNVPVTFIEAKVNDPNYHPPRQPQAKSSRVDALRRAPAQPRDVLTAADQATKAAIKRDLELTAQEKGSTHPIVQRSIEQAACEVRSRVLTPRAASEKFNVSVDDIAAQIKNPYYASNLPAPLGPKQRAKQKQTPSSKESKTRIGRRYNNSNEGRAADEKDFDLGVPFTQ